MTAELSAEQFRATMARFATGVTVVTTCAQESVHGMTANAFASLSLQPRLVLVCVARDAAMHGLLAASGVFAVTMLAAGQERLSTWFASSDRPSGGAQFDGVPWSPAPRTGCPVLDGGVGWLDCAVVAVHDGGDHGIFVGEVRAAGIDDARAPLVWFGGRYRALAPE